MGLILLFSAIEVPAQDVMVSAYKIGPKDELEVNGGNVKELN